MSLDVEAAKPAVQTIADAMDLSLEQAADGILRIVNENMAGALRVISVQRGHDPREFAMVAFGGAGPLHANAVAALMGSFPVIVPPSPGLLCALGISSPGSATSSRRRSSGARRTRPTTSGGDPRRARGRAREWMQTQGIAAGDQHVEFVADMRYHGQGYEIPVPWGTGLEETFNELHEQLYGFRMPNTASEIVNLRAVGTGDRPQPELPEQEPSRESFGPGTYARADLHPGATIAGPSIITEFDSTTVVLDGYVARDRPLLQHPDHRGAGMSVKVAEIPGPRGRSRHRRHHRERAPARALRDGRGAVPERHVAGHPRAARRVPDDHGPAGTDGRRPVRGLHQRDDGRLGPGRIPGDVILTTDPYKCSGSISHTNDWLVLVPIFYDDELVGLVARSSGTRWTRAGGCPARLPTGATTIFEEGSIIPPLKIVERGEVQDQVLKLILNNMRLPEMNRADLFAIIAACHAGEKRVMGLCERFGKDVYLATLQALLDRTHEAMRKLILLAIPEDKQTFEDYIDDDGLGNGPYKMKLTIWREGEEAWFDWSGTDPQALGPINFYLSEGMFKMFIGVYLIMVNDPDILFNDGFYPLLHVVMPEGCLPPRATRRRWAAARTGWRGSSTCCGGALTKQAPELQHRRRLRHVAVHAVFRVEGERRVLLLDGDPVRRHPQAPDRRRHGRALVVAAVREHPDRVPGGLLPPAGRRVHDRDGLRRSRPASRWQRRREALRVPGARARLDP